LPKKKSNQKKKGSLSGKANDLRGLRCFLTADRLFLHHRAIPPVKKKALPPYVGNIPFGRACLADGGALGRGLVEILVSYSVDNLRL